MTNEWGHLPNAYYIDCILSSLRSKPKMWDDIYRVDEELWDDGMFKRFRAAWSTAENIISNSAKWLIWVAASSGATTSPGVTFFSTHLARGAILALIAYDDAAQYLEWDAEKLEVMSILTESPVQFLMLPAVRALNQQLVQG